jgi:hypothetical protein
LSKLLLPEYFNQKEFNKVIYSPFYAVINKFKDQFNDLHFLSKKDKRGDLDLEIIEMVVLFFSLEVDK